MYLHVRLHVSAMFTSISAFLFVFILQVYVFCRQEAAAALLSAAQESHGYGKHILAQRFDRESGPFLIDFDFPFYKPLKHSETGSVAV